MNFVLAQLMCELASFTMNVAEVYSLSENCEERAGIAELISF